MPLHLTPRRIAALTVITAMFAAPAVLVFTIPHGGDIFLGGLLIGEIWAIHIQRLDQLHEAHYTKTVLDTGMDRDRARLLRALRDRL